MNAHLFDALLVLLMVGAPLLGASAVLLATRCRNGDLACIVCGCTDSCACPGGCGWVSIDPPLCSTCSPGWAA